MSQATPLGPQARNVSRNYAITLAGPGGGSAGSSLVGAFTGAEVILATLGLGGNYAPVATLPAAWDPSVAGNPSGVDYPAIRLGVPAATLAPLMAGSYAIQVVINPGRMTWRRGPAR
jgi:hypothetical protein